MIVFRDDFLIATNFNRAVLKKGINFLFTGENSLLSQILEYY